MDGWVDVKAVLRIAYSNQKLKLASNRKLFFRNSGFEFELKMESETKKRSSLVNVAVKLIGPSRLDDYFLDL